MCRKDLKQLRMSKWHEIIAICVSDLSKLSWEQGFYICLCRTEKCCENYLLKYYSSKFSFIPLDLTSFP